MTPNGDPEVSISGGHPVALARASGDVEELASHGPALGILPRFSFEERIVRMDPGDLLVVLSEVDAGLRRGVHALAADRRFESAAALAERLQSALLQAKGMRDPEQDVVVAVVKKVQPDPKRDSSIRRLEME